MPVQEINSFHDLGIDWLVSRDAVTRETKTNDRAEGD